MHALRTQVLANLLFGWTDGFDRFFQHFGVRVQQIHPIQKAVDIACVDPPSCSSAIEFLVGKHGRLLLVAWQACTSMRFDSVCWRTLAPRRRKGVGKAAFLVIEAIALIA
jgi:hypothetical protein